MEDVKVKEEPGDGYGVASFARGAEASTSGMDDADDPIAREIDVFVKPQLDSSTQVRQTILFHCIYDRAQITRSTTTTNSTLRCSWSVIFQLFEHKHVLKKGKRGCPATSMIGMHWTELLGLYNSQLTKS